MTVINTNVKALYTQAALKTSARDLSVAMQQLSTGKRINSAKDDAAGLAIATRMTQQIRSLNQAVRNAGDAISLIQTTEGATIEINDMLQRMRELSIQAINDTNSGEQRKYLDLEFQQLKQEIARIAETVEWNGFPILNGTAGEQVGERPVYKTTSLSRFGDIFIDPTTVRNAAGADAGEIQTFTFTGNAAQTGTITIGGVNVAVTQGDTPAVMVANAQATLVTNAAFDARSGRTVSVVDNKLIVAFGAAEKNATNLTFTAGNSGVTLTRADTARVAAVAQVDGVQLGGTLAAGDTVSITIGGEAISYTVVAGDIGSDVAATQKNVAAKLAAAHNASNSTAHTPVTATASTAVMTRASVTTAAANTAQVDTVTLSGNFVMGQKLSISIDSTALEYVVTAADMAAANPVNTIALNMANAFNNSSNAAHTPITASATGAVITLAADVDNAAFTSTSNAQGSLTLKADTPGAAFTLTSAGTGVTSDHVVANVIEISGDALVTTDEVFAANGRFLRSGSLSITKSAADNNAVIAIFKGSDKSEVTMTGTLNAVKGTVSFSATGENSKIISDRLTYTFKDANGVAESVHGRAVSLDVDVSGSIPAMNSGDLVINEITIGASYSTDDKLSPPNNAAGSAIAKAAAINRHTNLTGVHAVVNENTMHGVAQSGTAAVTGRVVINGIESGTITTVLNNTRESRSIVVTAINQISEKTGVRAIDSESDNEGVRLVAADGRNIEMRFITDNSVADFSARTGLCEGVQAGTISLESRVDDPIVISTTAAGDNHRAGLRLGDFSENISQMTTALRAPVSNTGKPSALSTGDLVINDVAIRASVASDDALTDTASLATTSNIRAASGVAIAKAINDSSSETGVTATANPVSTAGTVAVVDSTTPNGLYSLWVNGYEVKVEFNSTHTASERVLAVVNAVNPKVGATGVVARANPQGGVTLRTEDGRNLSVWFDDTTAATVTAAEFGLSSASGNAPGVSRKSQTATLANASTLYGGVTLSSEKAFTIKPGSNGYGPSSQFANLGFREGTFGGEVDQATSKMNPPNVGRMNFHVGASANQTITIDLADFGKNGSITGEITGDVDDTKPTVTIQTSEQAKAVLAKLDVAMDKVNATRANMGAVMNRLEHVIDNLTNVAMNSEASRSQIEDADYASASTEMAKTQIMQQAATAVLAQANQSQQNVLKLLQG